MKTSAVVSVRIDQETQRRIVQAAEKQGSTAAEFIRQAVQSELERLGGGGIEGALAALENRISDRLSQIPRLVIEENLAVARRAREAQAQQGRN